MFGFVFGALTGGLAIWYGRNRLRELTGNDMMGRRTSVADVLRSLADAAERRSVRAQRRAGSVDPSSGPRVPC
jgi:hypothetical protein